MCSRKSRRTSFGIFASFGVVYFNDVAVTAAIVRLSYMRPRITTPSTRERAYPTLVRNTAGMKFVDVSRKIANGTTFPLAMIADKF